MNMMMETLVKWLMEILVKYLMERSILEVTAEEATT
jgi:hypothetical protein